MLTSTERPTIVLYLANPSLGRAYLRMNGITHLTVSSHHLGEPGYQLWSGKADGSGWPTDYRRKRDAVADAREIGAAFPELTIVID